MENVVWAVVQEEEAAEGRQLSQAGKRGDEAGRRPPVEYGVMQLLSPALALVVGECA